MIFRTTIDNVTAFVLLMMMLSIVCRNFRIKIVFSAKHSTIKVQTCFEKKKRKCFRQDYLWYFVISYFTLYTLPCSKKKKKKRFSMKLSKEIDNLLYHKISSERRIGYYFHFTIKKENWSKVKFFYLSIAY